MSSRTSVDQRPTPPTDQEKTDVDVEAANLPTAPKEEEDEYPQGWKKVGVIMLGLYLSMFIVALDRTILGTAIPKITDDFHSINDVGWYASSYLLTMCAFQLIYGRIYTFYNPKWVLLWAILIFEIGSTVCGTAPNSNAFIIGRAIAGLGSAGIFSGAINIMVITIPLHRRPMFQGIFGAVFGIASVCGPLLGGVFTTKVSWRWCFYINLPVGAVVVVILLFILKSPPSKNTDTLGQQIMKLDPLGTMVFLPGIVCFLLALQWGGTTYPWSSPRVIALFVVAGVLIITFLFIQYKGGDRATVPFRIIKQRSVASGAYFSAVTPGSMMVIIYFLPIWFQAIKGETAVHSGIDTLPLVFSLVVASIMAGAVTTKSGYYVPQLLASSVIMSIGAGMITTLEVGTEHEKWIAYQFLYGFGLGLGMQQAGMAAQTCLAKKDVMIGVSIMFFFQGLGGAIFVSVGQNVFTQSLIKKLSTSLGSIAEITPAMIVGTGATDLRDIVPARYLPEVLIAYNAALSDTMKVGVACAAASIIGGLTMEWKSVKAFKKASEAAQAAKKKAQDEKAQGEEPATDADTPFDSPPPTAVNEAVVTKE